MSETPESQAQRAGLHEIIAVGDQLTTSPSTRTLVNRLHELYCEQLMLEGSHVLRLAGQLCLEYGQLELFEQLFRDALEGCQVNFGDELDFLGFVRGRLVRLPLIATPHPN